MVQVSGVQSATQAQKPKIEVLDVCKSKEVADLLLGFAIDSPAAGNVYEGNIIPLKGWTLGRKVPIIALEVASQDKLLQSIELNDVREDLVDVYPDIPNAKYSGFCKELSIGNFLEEIDLSLEAVLEDRTRICIASIRLGCKALISPEVEADLKRSRTLLREYREKLDASQNRIQQLRAQFEEGFSQKIRI
ncbi:MAG: hypothetical protein HC835_16770 [Oscillatoriales cyanobacterium RM2_1_1]|nr:hypothetical protein [Oscillatoriales cyanobacterium SM2_3_0]NJO47133.1 hypothetical protein [Oscillatoriales cyanobacterium RM2_1_1]